MFKDYKVKKTADDEHASPKVKRLEFNTDIHEGFSKDTSVILDNLKGNMGDNFRKFQIKTMNEK